MIDFNPILITDSYKLSHADFEVDGVTEIYSNFTPRFTQFFKQSFPDFDDKIVWFGLQYAIARINEVWDKNFFDRPKHIVIKEAMDILGPYIGIDNLDRFEELHDLGYLPILIKSLPEGSIINPSIPSFTTKNTHPRFRWLTNYLESVLSTECWKSMTVATISRQFRMLSEKYALLTADDNSFAAYQNHDFSFRGQPGVESAAIGGAAFLTSSIGTDNIVAIPTVMTYYDESDVSQIGSSIRAGEHSVTTLGITVAQNNLNLNGEYLQWKLENIVKGLESYVDGENDVGKLIGEKAYILDCLVNKFPIGPFAYVADSYSYWDVVDVLLPSIKDEILSRDGKFVVRGDSGNPVEIIAGLRSIEYNDISFVESNVNTHASLSTLYDVIQKDGEYYRFTNLFKEFDEINGVYYYIMTLTDIVPKCIVQGTVETMWNIFGGSINSKGYKELDSHIGMIYGDGITYERANEILKRLMKKGFAYSNIVFGIGSYTLSCLSRDDLGTAIKATNAIVYNDQVQIYKDPKTDTTKKSAMGLLCVLKDENGTFYLKDQVGVQEEQEGELKEFYRDGVFSNVSTFTRIRSRIKLSY